MKKQNFEKILEELKKEQSNSGGPLHVENLTRSQKIIDLNDILLQPEKKDCLIHIKYFPTEDRYGFSVYQEDKE